MMNANITKEKRKEIYRRDGYRCALCDSTQYIQIHHAVPRGEGGTNSPHNLITLCADCHALAHGMDLRGWGATKEDVDQAITEYLADYYAPCWNPWDAAPPPCPDYPRRRWCDAAGGICPEEDAEPP